MPESTARASVRVRSLDGLAAGEAIDEDLRGRFECRMGYALEHSRLLWSWFITSGCRSASSGDVHRDRAIDLTHRFANPQG
jgi:hypothetical protein